MPQKREITYPVFLECCKHATDVFWENVFENLAYGKPPTGTYISKGYIVCGYKGKEFSYKIERKDSKIIYDELCKLFKDNLGILSQKEKLQKKIVFDELEKNIKESRRDWSSIRKKNVKDMMFEKYVLDMKKEHGLTFKQCKYLLSVIFLSMMFKTITAKDIEYDNDKIERIEGIDFEEGKIILKRPINVPVCDQDTLIDETSSVKIPEKMSENWERFLRLVKERS